MSRLATWAAQRLCSPFGVVAGLLSLAGTFSYSEIAAMMPEAGGDYIYLRRAYGRLMGFLYGWMVFAVARAGSQAALAAGFAIFMNVALGGMLGNWHLGGTVLGLHLPISAERSRGAGRAFR